MVPAATLAASLVAFAAGPVVVLGWWLGRAHLPNTPSGLPRMTPLTAVGLTLAGIALGLLRRESPARPRRLLAGACAAGAVCVGALMLADHFYFGALGTDRFLTSAPETASSLPPSFHTGLILSLLGLALLLLATRPRRGVLPAQCAAILAGHVVCLVLVGYVFAVPALYRITFPPDAGVAIGTALAGGLLSAGVLCARPDVGFPAVLLSPGGGGVLVRRLLLTPILVPLAVGAGRLALRGAGIDSELVAWLFGLAYFVVFTSVFWWVAATVYRAENGRARADQRFRAVAETARQAILSTDRRRHVVYLNTAAAEMFGRPPGELLGRPLAELFPARFRADDSEITRHLTGGRGTVVGKPIELAGLRRDGTEFPVELSLAPWAVAGEAFFTAILSDVTDRKRAEEELRAVNGQLSDANKELEAFSYSVSHDLRAPLRSIDGFSRILLDDFAAALPAEAQEYLRDVRDSARQMGQLVDDLLAFARLSRQPVKTQRVQTGELVRQGLGELRPGAHGRRVELVVADLPPCAGDAALLKQVWVNLLANALKYSRTRDPARVEVGVRADGQPGEVTYFVKDNGVGFDMRFAHKLFGVFSRLHRAEEFEGTGVGLAIVQRVVHRHGGRVWADARPGEGATFFFTLKEATGEH
jgi:PAS domain S-box-containing protein